MQRRFLPAIGGVKVRGGEGRKEGREKGGEQREGVEREREGYKEVGGRDVYYKI